MRLVVGVAVGQALSRSRWGQPSPVSGAVRTAATRACNVGGMGTLRPAAPPAAGVRLRNAPRPRLPAALGTAGAEANRPVACGLGTAGADAKSRDLTGLSGGGGPEASSETRACARAACISMTESDWEWPAEGGRSPLGTGSAEPGAGGREVFSGKVMVRQAFGTRSQGQGSRVKARLHRSTASRRGW
jgi:hypothetical protein